jgi:Acetyltransferase (GNAT) domain
LSATHWSVIEHRGSAGLKAIEADWRRLYAEMPRTALWHSHEAYSVYIDHLCPNPERFMCLGLSDGQRIRAILPVEERFETGFGVPLRVWGMPWRSAWRPTDAIGPEDDARRALLPAAIEHLRRQPGRPGILVLGQSWDESVLWRGLDELASSSWFAFPDGAEFVIPTGRSFHELEASLSANSRKKLGKAAREFEALPEAHYVCATSPHDLAEEYEHFLDVEGSGWKAERGSAIKQRPELVAFYRDLLERVRLDGRCEIHSLHAEGRCIASDFCTITRHEGAALKGGYDESYARLTPGRLLAHKGLQWGCEDPGVDVVSEVSDAPWLLMWHPTQNGLRRAYVSLRPVSGRLSLLALRLRYGPARRLVRAYKAWRARQVHPTAPQRGRDAG